MQDKQLSRIEAKLDALLAAHEIDAAGIKTPTPARRPTRALTAAQQQAIDNAPKPTPAQPIAPGARVDANIEPLSPSGRQNINAPVVNAPSPRATTPSSAPWPGYDDAASEAIIEQLRGLDSAGRAAALAYEVAHKNRVTITRVNWNS